MTKEKKVTNKEAAIRLVMQALCNLDYLSREKVEDILGARTTESRVDKIREEVEKQRTRCEKLFAKYLEGRTG